MKKVHYKVYLQGKVQGVGLRYNAKQQADKLNVCGYARNLHDGTVVVELEGAKDKLEQFLVWCRTGNYSSYIKQIDVEQTQAEGYREFSVF